MLLAAALAVLVWIAVVQSVAEGDDAANQEASRDHKTPIADSTKHGAERV